MSCIPLPPLDSPPLPSSSGDVVDMIDCSVVGKLTASSIALYNFNSQCVLKHLIMYIDFLNQSSIEYNKLFDCISFKDRIALMHTRTMSFEEEVRLWERKDLFAKMKVKH